METTGSGINTNKKQQRWTITLVFNLIHGVASKMNRWTVILTKGVENVQRGMSNANVELKNEKVSGKHVFDVKSKTKV